MPAAAQAAGTVYVTTPGSKTVSQYGIGAGGELSPLTPETVGAGTDPLGIAVSPDGKSAYATDRCPSCGGNNNQSLFQYDIDPQSGGLSPKTPPTVAAGFSGMNVVVTPDGKNAYVTDFGSIFQYDIDPASGALSPKTPATVAGGSGSWGIAVTPDGKSAYVANFGGVSVSQYNIDPLSGALSPKSPATVAAGTSPKQVAVSPDGRSAYVTNKLGNTVSQYDIDPVSGALSPKTPANVATGDGPEGIAVSPNGKSAYVANYGSGATNPDAALYQYDIDPVSGALSPKSPASFFTPTPFGIAVSPDGKSAYVTNVNSYTVSEYDTDPQTGALSLESAATLATGSLPRGIAVGPLPQSNPTGAPPTTTVDSGPTGTISASSATFAFSASDPGASFECSLDGGAFSSCSSPYTTPPLAAGAHTFSVRARNAGGAGAPASRSFTVAPTTAPTATTAQALPPPVLGQSVNTAPVSGTVLVRLAGTNKFVKLVAGQQLPVGSTVDTTKGVVRLTSAANASGATQTANFYQGIFVITQGKSALTDLALTGGGFARCPTGRARRRASESRGKKRSKTAVIRKLWGDGKGKFQTSGRYSAAAVRGTIWEVADRCDGTLTTVRRGTVTVRDFVRKRTVIVKAPRSYLARRR